MQTHLIIALTTSAGLAGFLGCATDDTTKLDTQPAQTTDSVHIAQAPAAEQPAAQPTTQPAAQPTEQPATQPESRPRRQRRQIGPAFGAVDEDARRTTGEAITDIFAPLDLPTPSSMRLGSGAPGPDWWQQRTDYIINAEVDPENRRLDATMTITYHNNSPHALDYMWIQLEQNLFKPDSLGTQSRTPGSVMSTDLGAFDGGYDIVYLRTGEGELQYHVYDTLARVELPEPIEPGEHFTFDMAFGFNMPPHLRRMGAEDVEQGTIFEYAQWFPHVAKYDDVNGWNTLPYIGNGEFYTDFGDYEVNITVPREFIVDATGTLQNAEEVFTATQLERIEAARNSEATVLIIAPEEVGTPENRPAGEGALTWQFKAENVRTVAFATSNAFIMDGCKAIITDLDGNEQSVFCKSLYPKEAEAWYWNRDYLPSKPGGSSQYIKHAIEFYSDWIYPYPYPEMTNVNGPEGGMEYPMMIFCGARTNDPGLFGVTDHEVGHNWYPMLVNSDERRYMWMDEGFNSFINIYSNNAYYGESQNRRGGAAGLLNVMNAENPQASNTPADRHWPRWVGTLNYSKPAWALHLLREVVLGPDRFDTAWKTYTHRWAFKHPQPADFFRTMEDAAGADLSWFWRGWLLPAATIDQGVTAVDSMGESQAGVTLVNVSDMVMPVIMDVTFSDGETQRLHLPVEIWGAANVWRVPVTTGDRSITRVSIDPDGMYPDADRDNNVWESGEADSEQSENE